jgi:hypothetical protein
MFLLMPGFSSQKNIRPRLFQFLFRHCISRTWRDKDAKNAFHFHGCLFTVVQGTKGSQRAIKQLEHLIGAPQIGAGVGANTAVCPASSIWGCCSHTGAPYGGRRTNFEQAIDEISFKFTSNLNFKLD